MYVGSETRLAQNLRPTPGLSALSFFIFFQAEHGIRDTSVTGVQACALPIWLNLRVTTPKGLKSGIESVLIIATKVERSVERRVGKESRSRWSPYHSKQT